MEAWRLNIRRPFLKGPYMATDHTKVLWVFVSLLGRGPGHGVGVWSVNRAFGTAWIPLHGRTLLSAFCTSGLLLQESQFEHVGCRVSVHWPSTRPRWFCRAVTCYAVVVEIFRTCDAPASLLSQG